MASSSQIYLSAYESALCLLFFDGHQCCDVQNVDLKTDHKVIIIYLFVQQEFSEVTDAHEW